MRLLDVLILFAAGTWGTSCISLYLSRHSCHVNDRERLVWILGSLVLEFLLVSGPSSTFNKEPVDANTFCRHSELFFDLAIFTADDFFEDIGLWLNGIKRPLLLGVLSGDFLHCSREETLWIVESSKPE